MTAHTHYLWFQTKARQEIIDITDQVAEQVGESGVAEGFVLVSAMHITASVFVNDHESGLWADILRWLETTIAPWDPQRYRHNETGEDNAAAHLRSLTIGHEVIVARDGRQTRSRALAASVLRRVGWTASQAGDHQGAGGVGSVSTARSRVSFNDSVRHFPEPSDHRCRRSTNQPWSRLTQSVARSSACRASSLQQSNLPAGTTTHSVPVTRRSSGVKAARLAVMVIQLTL